MVASSATWLPCLIFLVWKTFTLAAGEDQSCDGKGGEDDEMGLGQLRAVTHHRDSAKQSPPVFVPPAALVTTSYASGAFPSTVTSSVKALQVPMLMTNYKENIESTYGCGGSGCSWNAGFAVLYTNESEATTLELEITSSDPGWTLNAATVVVGYLPAPLPSKMDWSYTGAPGEGSGGVNAGSVACPPSYCLPGPPAGVDPASGFSHCGFAPSGLTGTAVAPTPGVTATISIDVTMLIAYKYTVFQVWVSPSDVSEGGSWQTAQYKINSWKFV